MLTKVEVEQIADLARLQLTEEQIARYQAQLSAILAYADRLNELNLEDVEPTTHAVPVHNVWREDVVTPTLELDDVLRNAPQHVNDQFVVQAVLDES